MDKRFLAAAVGDGSMSRPLSQLQLPQLRRGLVLTPRLLTERIEESSRRLQAASCELSTPLKHGVLTLPSLHGIHSDQ